MSDNDLELLRLRAMAKQKAEAEQEASFDVFAPQKPMSDEDRQKAATEMLNIMGTGSAVAADNILLGNLPRIEAMIQSGELSGEDVEKLTQLKRKSFEETKEQYPVSSGVGGIGGVLASLMMNPSGKAFKFIESMKASPLLKSMLKVGTSAAEGAGYGALAEPGPDGSRLENAKTGALVAGGVSTVGQGIRHALGGEKGANKWGYQATGPTQGTMAEVGDKAEDFGRILHEEGVTTSELGKTFPFFKFIPPSKAEMYERIVGQTKRDKFGNIVYSAKNTQGRGLGLLDKYGNKINDTISGLESKNIVIDPEDIHNRAMGKLFDGKKITPGVFGADEEKKLNSLREVTFNTPTNPRGVYDAKIALDTKVYDTASTGIEKMYNKAKADSIREIFDNLVQTNMGKEARREFQKTRRAYEALASSADNLKVSQHSKLEKIGGNLQKYGVPSTAVGASVVASNPQMLLFAPAVAGAMDIARKPELYGSQFIRSNPAAWGLLYNQMSRPSGEQLYTPADGREPQSEYMTPNMDGASNIDRSPGPKDESFPLEYLIPPNLERDESGNTSLPSDEELMQMQMMGLSPNQEDMTTWLRLKRSMENGR